MTLVTDRAGNEPVVAQYLSEYAKVPLSSDLRVLGLMREDFTIAAAVGYNLWQEDSCFIHVAFDSPHSLTREFLREAFIYPFVTCQRQVLYGMTPITNEKIVRFSQRLGSVEVFRNQTFVLQEMRRENCRWIKGVINGRQQFPSSST